MKINPLEQLKLYILYVKYAQALGYTDFETFIDEKDIILEYLYDYQNYEYYKYKDFRNRKLNAADRTKTARPYLELPKNYKFLEGLLRLAKSQNKNLREVLDYIEHYSQDMTAPGGMTNHCSVEKVAVRREDREDGTFTYYFDMYTSEHRDKLSGHEISIKIDMTPDANVSRIEFIRHFVYSRLSPRDTFRIIIEDIDKDECLVSKDKYSVENYFADYDKSGQWCNISTEIIPRNKSKEKVIKK